MIGNQKIPNRCGYGTTLIVFVVIPLIVFGGFLFFSYSYPVRKNTHTVQNIIPELPSQETALLDSDNDGLKDWEERVYNTDIHNPDSDKDGTKDGDEIAQGRDPRKSGPKDELTKNSAPAILSAETTTEPPNLTQKLAATFGMDYIIRLIKNPNNAPDITLLADKMAQIALTDGALHNPSPLTTKDIIILSQATKNDTKHYLEQMITTFYNTFAPIASKKNLNEIINDILKNDQSPESLAAEHGLKKRIEAYNQFLAGIKALRVPDDFARLHLEYLNAMVKEREALTKISAVQEDVVLAIVGLKEFTETTTEFHDIQNKYHELGKVKGLL